jgi:hypothetical protein
LKSLLYLPRCVHVEPCYLLRCLLVSCFRPNLFRFTYPLRLVLHTCIIVPHLPPGQRPRLKSSLCRGPLARRLFDPSTSQPSHLEPHSKQITMKGCYCSNYYGSIGCRNTVSKFGERCKLCVVSSGHLHEAAPLRLSPTTSLRSPYLRTHTRRPSKAAPP